MIFLNACLKCMFLPVAQLCSVRINSIGKVADRSNLCLISSQKAALIEGSDCLLTTCRKVVLFRKV